MASGAGRGKMLGLVLGLVIVIAAIGVAAFALSGGGGGGTGTCVITWSDMPTNRLTGYTQAECDAKCLELHNEQSCYWEP